MPHPLGAVGGALQRLLLPYRRAILGLPDTEDDTLGLGKGLLGDLLTGADPFADLFRINPFTGFGGFGGGGLGGGGGGAFTAWPSVPFTGTIRPTAIANSPIRYFPVVGADPSDIGSFYGDPRDGGTRLHQGVDIFAPQGTPILAGIRGEFERVSNPLGGISYTIQGPAGRIYGAHLSGYADVPTGTQVRPRQVIGYVGRTGNARTTPPHLHFQFDPGPRDAYVDPLPYLSRVQTVRSPTRRSERAVSLTSRLRSPVRASSRRIRSPNTLAGLRQLTGGFI